MNHYTDATLDRLMLQLRDDQRAAWQAAQTMSHRQPHYPPTVLARTQR